MTIGVKEEEIISYDIANYLPLAMTTAVVLTSLLAIASFLVYNYKVATLKHLLFIGFLLINILFSFIPGVF